MFGATKKIEEIEKLISELGNRIQSQNVEIAKLKETNEELAIELDDSRNSLKSFSEELKTACEGIKQSDNNLKNEITDFKLFVSKIKKDILTELTAEFSREMKETTVGIYADLESFRELKNEADLLKAQTSQMKQEMAKLIEISSKIRSADFELAKYSRLIEEGDKEKLELMRKIDTLERLVAKQRRIQ
jgi:chromosome segregation ATPase